MAINPQTGEYTPDVELTAEDDAAMLTALNQLDTDPDAPGVGMEKLRTFYPRNPWTDIQYRLNRLVEAGTVAKKMRKPPGGKVAFAYYRAVPTEE